MTGDQPPRPVSEPSDTPSDDRPPAASARAPRHAQYSKPSPAGERPSTGRFRRSKKNRKPRSLLREFLTTVAWALVFAIIIKTFLVQAFYIPSESMNSTLQVGDRILVSKLAPGPLKVHRGDVVVFVDPGGWLDASYKPKLSPVGKVVNDVFTFIGLLPANSGEHLIKRVIGVGGDTVSCCTEQGQLTVNGVAIDEPYLHDSGWYAKSNRPQDTFTITVPPDSLWVMGDNRLNSLDSRYHLGDPGGGSIPLKQVVGVAFLITWPLDRLEILRNPGATFADVP